MSQLLDQLTKCENHDSKWLLTGTELCSQQICGKCCHYLLSSDVCTKDILSFLSSVRNSRQLASVLNSCRENGEQSLFVLTISGHLFHKNPEIQSSAKICLKNLINQINNNSVLNNIFEDIISEINKFELTSIGSVIELMADFNEDIEVYVNEWTPLTDDNDFDPKSEFNQLIRRFQDNFHRLSVQIREHVLRIIATIYRKSEPTFELDLDFHLKTLRMLFITFEKFNCYSDESKSLAIRLLKWLSKIDSILQLFINDENFSKYLKNILNENSVNIRKLAIDWICDQLMKDSIRTRLTTIIEDKFMDWLINLLVTTIVEQTTNRSLIDNSILRNLLECLTLIIDNQRPQKPISAIRLEALTLNIVRCLEISVRTSDDQMFQICLSTILLLVRKFVDFHSTITSTENTFIKCLFLLFICENRSQKCNFMTEFDFIGILTLIEGRICSSNLFQTIVDFLCDYFQLSVMPVIVPANRLSRLLELLFTNIKNNNIFDGDDCRQLTIRSISVVRLIESILNLIDSLKDKDLDMKPKVSSSFDFHSRFQNQPIDSNSSIGDNRSTDLYSLLDCCLKDIDFFFTKCLADLKPDTNFEDNCQLFHQICGCLKVLFDNKLFVSQDIIRFVRKMFISGDILDLNKLFWVCELPLNDRFVTDVSTIVSLFVCQLQELEYQNRHHIDLDLSLYRNVTQLSIHQQMGIGNDLIIGIEETETETKRQEIHNFFSAFFAVHYYSLVYNSKNYSTDSYHFNTFSKILIRFLTKYLKKPEDNIQTIITVKHSLFLSTFVELDEHCFTALRQLFDGTDQQIQHLFSNCYTNDVMLLKWLFTHHHLLFREETNSFCTHAIKEMFDSSPDSGADRKQVICSIFESINSSERVLQVFIEFLFYAIEDQPIIETIEYALEDTDEFLDESAIHQNWMNFRLKILRNIPTIVHRLTQEIKELLEFGSDLNPFKQRKVIKILSFVMRLLSNAQNQYDFIELAEEFKELLPDLRHLMDKDLDESSLHTIFKFFRTCMASDEDFGSIQRSFTDYLLTEDSKTLFLICNCVNNYSATDCNKTTAIYLLSKLSQNRAKYQMTARFEFNLDIKRLVAFLNSDSIVEVENAFILLSDWFDIDFYFENKKKSPKVKIQEMRELLAVLQNAAFRQLLSLTQMSEFLDKLFDGLKSISMLALLRDLANGKWFPIIIITHITEYGLQSQPLIDFLLTFCRLDFIIESLIPIMNGVVTSLVEKVNESPNQTQIDDNVYKLFKTIHLGQYSQHLSQQNAQHLVQLSDRVPMSQPLVQSGDHNYSLNPTTH